MMKSELTEAQVAERAAFVSALAGAGWDVRGMETLWDAGMSVEPEATLELNRGDIALRLGWFMGRMGSGRSPDAC